jgi:hypothetical protein
MKTHSLGYEGITASLWPRLRQLALKRRNRSMFRRALLVAVVVSASGCATWDPNHPKGPVSGALTGAAAGALAGGKCGPLIIICAPIGAVVGTVAGAVMGAENAADAHRKLGERADPKIAARPASPEWSYTPEKEDELLQENSLNNMGMLDDQGPLQGGVLFFNPNSVQPIFHREGDLSRSRMAEFVVNFRSKVDGYSSYVASAQVSCDLPRMSIEKWVTYSKSYAAGDMREEHDMNPPLVIEEDDPESTLGRTMKAVCKSNLEVGEYGSTE